MNAKIAEEMVKRAKDGDLEGAIGMLMAVVAEPEDESVESEQPSEITRPADTKIAAEGLDRMRSVRDSLMRVAEGHVTICGYDLPIDFTDSDVLERFQEAYTEYDADLAAAQAARYPNAFERNRAQCECVEKCLDAIFGDGTSEKVFEGHRASLAYHFDGIMAVLDAADIAGKMTNDVGNMVNQRIRAQINKRNAQQFRNFAAQAGGNRQQRRRKH